MTDVAAGHVVLRVELDFRWHRTPGTVLVAILDQLSEMGFRETGHRFGGAVEWRIPRPDFVSSMPEWGELLPPLLENDLPGPVRRAVDQEYLATERDNPYDGLSFEPLGDFLRRWVTADERRRRRSQRLSEPRHMSWPNRRVSS